MINLETTRISTSKNCVLTSCYCLVRGTKNLTVGSQHVHLLFIRVLCRRFIHGRLKAQETPMFGLHFSKSLLPSVIVGLHSPQVHTSKQAPVLQNVTGFGDTVFKEVIKLRLLRWFLIQDDCYPYCCCCLVTKSCPSLCIPMDCNIPGFPVLHCLPEFAQTHVH